jgi:hypothetical protein
MKSQSFIGALSVCVAASFASAQVATVNGSGSVNGNGNAGFGGVIGTGSLQIETLGDGTVNMTVTRGAGGWFDLGAMYIDSVVGGVSNTSSLSDLGDGGRAGLSGSGFGGEHSDLGFGANFAADYGITWETAFSGIFDLTSDSSNFGFVAAVSADGARDANDASFSISFNMSDIGLNAGDSFRVVMTYLNSGNAFRSGEFIGSDDTGPFANDPNIGQTAYQLGDEDYILVNTVPAPGAFALLGMGGLVAGRRRR